MSDRKRRRSADEDDADVDVDADIDADIDADVDADADVDDSASLLVQISKALSSDASENVFAIGGTIDLNTSHSTNSVGRDHVVIRWDSGEGQCRKVALPVRDNTTSQAAFQQLLEDCQPATFGKGKEDVLDETYRKAGKMDVTNFCADFNLSEHGIIETVVQALGQRGVADKNTNGVRAELYKLNVYSGPSGKFKRHVDTPRSDTQMGSLVVCLPSPHQGGALVVRHGERQVQFDWSTNQDSIQWAAFFSDCEHEVLQVSEGHRLTLTYNLHWTDYGPSLMATHLGALDQTSLHFYAALENLVNCPSFLPKGGLIGFSCTHGYPHTSRSAMAQLNSTLKGLDMLVYQTLKRLTGSAQVRAVLDGSQYDEERHERGEDKYDSDSSSDSNDGDFMASRSYLADFLFNPILREEYEEDQGLDPASIEHQVSHNKGPWQSEWAFPRRKVTWLNGVPRSFEELAVAFIAYGNQASIDAYYSTAVIISYLPKYVKRTGDRKVLQT